MQNFPEIQGVLQKIFFSFPFSLFFLLRPEGSGDLPASPSRRRHVPAAVRAWITTPSPCPALSLSHSPLALFLSLCSPELNPSSTPSAARRRRCSRPRASPSTPSAPPSPSAPSPRRNRAPVPRFERSTPFPAVLTSAVTVDSTAAVAPPAPSTSPPRSSPHGELPGALRSPPSPLVRRAVVQP